MKYLKTYQESLSYISYKTDEDMNEGLKHWMATFLLLANMGMVPLNIQKADAQTKKEFVESIPQKTIEDVKNGIVSVEKIQPVNYVNDYANIVDDNFETQMNQMLKSYESTSDVEIAVLTIPSLDGNEVADFGVKTFNRWGVGKKSSNNGVLITIAVDDHKWNITTGYGVEDILTDYDCSEIGQENLTAYFKQGDYPGGIDACVKAIMEKIGKENVQFKKERLAKEKEASKAAMANFFSILLQVLLGLAAASGVIYLLWRRNKEIQDRKNKINSLIADSNRMGTTLEEVLSNDVFTQSEELKNLKIAIKPLMENPKYNNKYLTELSTRVNELSAIYADYKEMYTSFKSVSKSIQQVSTYIYKGQVPNEIKVLGDQLTSLISDFNAKDIDPAKMSKLEATYLTETRPLLDKYSKMLSTFKELESAVDEFDETKANLTKKIKYSIDALNYIKETGYNFDEQLPRQEQVDKLSSIVNTIKSICLTNFPTAIQQLKQYSAAKSEIETSASKVIDYGSYIKNIKGFVENFNVDSLIQKYKQLKADRDFQGVTDNIPASIEKLRTMLETTKDYIKTKAYIDVVTGLLNREQSAIDEVVRRREQEERRREQEEEDRRRRKRQQEEDDERRRNSYSSSSSSYDSGSSSSSSSSFGGFGGGSSGGGGASGGW